MLVRAFRRFTVHPVLPERIAKLKDGKNGYEVKSKTNGNSIFLPAAGYRGGSVLFDAGSEGR